MIVYMIRSILNWFRRTQPEATTKAEREEVAGRSREWRSLIGPLMLFTFLTLIMLAVAVVRVSEGGWMPLVLS